MRGADKHTQSPEAMPNTHGTAPKSSPKRKKAPPKKAPASAEDMLERAINAPTTRGRVYWARRGLAFPGKLDRATQMLLLRQLYMAYYETLRFQQAVQVAEQAIGLGVLTDVAHQDAARAKQALADIEGAAGHLRLAARTGPPSRKAFHYWTLGSLYFLAGHFEQAIAALERAARWGTGDKALYQGHLAIVRCASGNAPPTSELEQLIDRLSRARAAQGYGRFILGHLAYYAGHHREAQAHLQAFMRRGMTGRPALALSLSGEIAMAKAILDRLSPVS